MGVGFKGRAAHPDGIQHAWVPPRRQLGICSTRGRSGRWHQVPALLHCVVLHELLHAGPEVRLRGEHAADEQPEVVAVALGDTM